MPAPWQHTVQQAVQHAWLGRGVLAMCLYPLSLLYRLLSGLRWQCYARGLLPTLRVPATVVVVGNVVAGGAGKTPTTIALVQHLQSQNIAVGVISRGYGRKHDHCTVVQNESTPRDVGDEPLLIYRAAQVPVVVGRSRVDAAQILLARYPATQVIVCDDGLQHHRLHRDIEICVFDNRGCGNHWLLPAGPLREAWPHQPTPQMQLRADQLLVLHTGNHPAFAGFKARRSLSLQAKRYDGSRVDLRTWHAMGGKPLLAVAGIAQPDAFFSMLREHQLNLTDTVAVPDHYTFESWPRSLYAGYTIICTEKDAVKLWRIDPDALAVALIFEPEPAFFSAVDAQLAQVRKFTPLSSTYGHQTT